MNEIQKELEQEWGTKPAFPPVEEEFRDGFSRRTVIGALFLAFIMLPGSIYSGFIAGQGLGTAAQWVTVILFTEMTRRSFTFLTRQEIFVIYALAGSLVVGGGPFFGLIWNQFLVQSSHAETLGIASELSKPENRWIVPPVGSEALTERSLWNAAWWWNPESWWKSPVMILFLSATLGWINYFGLGYLMFRVTNDVERLPFPLAPVAAEGVTALAESYSTRAGWRWRVFTIGAAIGCIFGVVYVFLPGFTGAVMNKAVDPLTKPFWDWALITEAWLPAAILGLTPALGLVFTGFVLPFRLVLGSAVAAVLFQIILNPILYHQFYLEHWKPGMGTLATQVANNLDLWMSFGIGSGIAVACIGLGTVLRAAVSRPRVMAYAWIPAAVLGAPLLASIGWWLGTLSPLREHIQYAQVIGLPSGVVMLFLLICIIIAFLSFEDSMLRWRFLGWTGGAGGMLLVAVGMAASVNLQWNGSTVAVDQEVQPWLIFGLMVGWIALGVGLFGYYQQTKEQEEAILTPTPSAAITGVNLGPGKHRGDIPIVLAVALWAGGTVGLVALCHALVPKFPVWMFLLYGFVWTPVLSYISARMFGLAGRSLEISNFREGSFIVATKNANYLGVDVWFAPIPLMDAGWVAQFYREAVLTRTKISSLIKAQLFTFPLLVIGSIFVCALLWKLAPIPSAAHPEASSLWPVNAFYQTQWLSAAQTGSGPILNALTPDRILLGLGVGLGLYFVFIGLRLPMLFFWGFIGGMGTLPHGVIPMFAGACLGKYYFAKKFGKEKWHAYAPVLAAGFACGLGLLVMVTIAIQLIAKSAVQAPY